MKRQVKRIIVLCAGTGLVLLGIIGLFLPFLQGILFIVAGLLVLSRESTRVKRLLDRWKERHPQLYTRVTDFVAGLSRRFGPSRPK